jgi:hypothetical protein
MTNLADVDTMILPDRLPDFGITFCNVHRLRLEREGRFPRRVYLSERKPAYRLAEIKAFLESRVSERDKAPA